jgi:hypothetical protein
MELRRLIVLRRQQLDIRLRGDGNVVDLVVALDRVESLHDMIWSHTWTPEAREARDGTNLDRRASAA